MVAAIAAKLRDGTATEADLRRYYEGRFHLVLWEWRQDHKRKRKAAGGFFWWEIPFPLHNGGPMIDSMDLRKEQADRAPDPAPDHGNPNQG